jgi:arylsulfatase A-like enzyme
MNIAVIVLDTLRRDKVSVYNDDVDFTENLERFSSNSAVYENAVAQGPWTLPSHASIFTGEYPWKHNATQETLYLEDEFKQLPEIFSEKGYSTGAFSDNPWISSSSGLERGFDQLENYLPDVVEKADESDYLDLKSIMNHGGWFIDF